MAEINVQNIARNNIKSDKADMNGWENSDDKYDKKERRIGVASTKEKEISRISYFHVIYFCSYVSCVRRSQREYFSQYLYATPGWMCSWSLILVTLC